MKKGLFFLFIILIFFTGCKNELTVQKSFSAGVYISNENINVRGNFIRNNNNDLSLTVISPKELSGYSYTVKEDTVTMEYMGISSSCKISRLPKDAPIRILQEVLREFDNKIQYLKYDKDGYKVKVSDYIVKVGEEGYITYIGNSSTHISFVNQSN
ncbi:MAG: hypothetical protein ACI4HZ_05475 [Ruminococcus sp.]